MYKQEQTREREREGGREGGREVRQSYHTIKKNYKTTQLNTQIPNVVYTHNKTVTVTETYII